MRRIFERETKFLYLIGILIDIAAIVLADLSAFWLRLGKEFYLANGFVQYKKVVLLIIIFKLTCLYVFQLYSISRFKTNFITFINILKATTATSLIMAIIAYSFGAETIPRLVIVWSWALTLIFLFSWRMLVKGILELILGKDFFQLNLLIIGTDRHAEEMAILLLNNGSINYKFIGFISESETESRQEVLGYPVLGLLKNLNKITRQYHIDQVFVTTKDMEAKDVSFIFSALRRRREVTFCASPNLCEGLGSSSPFFEGRVKFIPAVPFQRVAVWYPPVKRILGVLFSSMLLIILMPIMIIVALAIKFSSSGPVFYLTRRVGYMGKEFVMYKFRSMYHLSDQVRAERWAQKYDKRITPVGKIIRRFRIDELPQLINVFKGDMSLIGPRPESKYYVTTLSRKIPLYLERLNVRPGISGWAQVNYGYAGSIEASLEKLLFDIYYIQNQSISLDLLIVLRTFKTVITGAGL